MNETKIKDPRRTKGRGASSNGAGRFEVLCSSEWDDGWEGLGQLEKFKTEIREEHSKTIITRNQSPDISFDRSINPYRGCEHGCIYCFARPSHAFWGLSAGLDFETKLTARVNASTLLVNELAQPGYQVRPIVLGTNTDPYQPIERQMQITRSLIEVLFETRHPLNIVTKSAAILRDLDLLAQMAEEGLVKVALSVTTLDGKLARQMEPRASQPKKRLEALGALNQAGVPTTVMVAPVIPGLTDHEIEGILEEASAAGVREAQYILLRLPLEIKDLFEDWLHGEFPDRASRVLSLIRSMRGGSIYEARFGARMRGEGPFADLIAKRFQLQIRRLGMNEGQVQLRDDLFIPPVPVGGQMRLF